MCWSCRHDQGDRFASPSARVEGAASKLPTLQRRGCAKQSFPARWVDFESPLWWSAHRHTEPACTVTFLLKHCLGSLSTRHYLVLSHPKPITLHVPPAHQPQGDIRQSESPKTWSWSQMWHNELYHLGWATLCPHLCNDGFDKKITRVASSSRTLWLSDTTRSPCYHCAVFPCLSLGFALCLEKAVTTSTCLFSEKQAEESQLNLGILGFSKCGSQPRGKEGMRENCYSGSETHISCCFFPSLVFN